MELVKENYCCDCDWSANERDHTRVELNTAIFEHFEETGHSIDCRVLRFGDPSSEIQEE